MLRIARGVAVALAAAAAAAIAPPAPAAAADPNPVSVVVSRSAAVSGQPMTLTPLFTPAFPDGYQFASTTICSWELRWGDDASLLHNDYDATFGSLLLRGKGSDGFCDPWTFTLPYSASAKWQLHFQYAVDDTHMVETPYTTFGGSNGAPAGTGIAESTLPGVWLSLPRGTREDEPVTATAHAFGGYVIPPDGTHWDAYGPCDCAPFASTTNHSLTFTFKAKVAGTITVFYNDSGSPETGGPNFAGAGIDPKVIAVKVTASVPTTMHRRVSYAVSARASGFVGTVRYAWYVDGVLRFVGRTGHVRFAHVGWHTIKVVATDSHGHRAHRTLSRYVRR
jgi:hypothetical protein